MKWFKHQSDARNSLKLRKVRRKYGADGYAIYWFCLEAIAYDVDKDNLTFELKEDAETIAFELSIQEKRVEEIMYYMVEIGLFESSANMITCMKLAESIDKSMTNSPKMRKWLEGKNVMTLPDNANACAELEVEVEVEVEVEKEKNKNTMSDSSNADAVEILNYLNEVTGSKFKKSTDSHLKPIRARLKDGNTVDDFKLVIDFKFKQWKGTQQAQYLRPSTLFIPKNFDGYLIAAKTAKPQHNVNDIGRDFSAPANWSN